MRIKKSDYTGKEHPLSEIEFVESVKITSDTMIKISPLLRIVQLIFITFSVYGTIFSFISGFQVKVYGNILMSAIFLSAIYFSYILRSKRARTYLLGLSALLLIIGLHEYWLEFENGFWNLENIFIKQFNKYYGTRLDTYIVGDYNLRYINTIFFLFLLLALTWLTSAVIIRHAFRSLYFILSFLLQAFSFSVGCMPAATPFLSCLICMVGIIGMGSTMREGKRNHSGQRIEKSRVEEDLRKDRIYNRFLGMKIGGVLAVILFGVILFISAIFTPKDYSSMTFIKRAKTKLQNEMQNFTIAKFTDKNIFHGLDLTQTTSYSGGLSGGKLGNVDEVVFTYKTVLRTELPNTGTSMYLKGYVGSMYQGNSWSGLTSQDLQAYNEIAKMWEKSDFEIGNQSSYFLSVIQELDPRTYSSLQYSYGSIKVNNIHGNTSYLYAPYYSIYSNQSMKVNDSQYVTPVKRLRNYKLNYYTDYYDLRFFDEEEEYQKCINYYYNFTQRGGKITPAEEENLDLLAQYRAYEAAYREFVYKTYTRVPENGLNRLKQEFGTIQYTDLRKQYGANTLDYLIQLVRSYLFDRTSYTLAPGKLPQGKDFVEYFLYESKVGYCVYYATAATMMFRVMGIPARYVEGYVVRDTNISKGKDNGKTTVGGRFANGWDEYQVSSKIVDIPDANAHAWVEIYLDGYGWIPIEVTPGNTDSGDRTNISSDLKKQVAQITAAPTRGLTTPTQAAAENKNKEETENKAKTTPTQAPDKKTKEEAHDWSFYILKLSNFLSRVFLLLFLSVAIILLRYTYLRWKLKKSLETQNRSKRILILYEELEKAFLYLPDMRKEEVENHFNVNKDETILAYLSTVRLSDTVLKARFHKVMVSRKEEEEFQAFYHDFVSKLYEKNSLKNRLYIKYILVFV